MTQQDEEYLAHLEKYSDAIMTVEEWLGAMDCMDEELLMVLTNKMRDYDLEQKDVTIFYLLGQLVEVTRGF